MKKTFVGYRMHDPLCCRYSAATSAGCGGPELPMPFTQPQALPLARGKSCTILHSRTGFIDWAAQ